MINAAPDDVLGEVEAVCRKVKLVRTELAKVIFGQDKVISLVLTNLLAGGHALLVGLPGLAKTSIVSSLGQAIGLSTKRIQFTPDLMPSDIIGSEVLEEKSGSRSFRFIPGPVFAQLLMADEINRASPKTQSALLQAMQEGQVTYAGHSYRLPTPFFVLATQNPLEQEGTYPLPEAQLDRFMMQIDVPYPEEADERKMLLFTTGIGEQHLKAALTPEQLLTAQRLVRQIPVGEHVVDAILKLVRSARPDSQEANSRVKELVAWGPGPRASQALMLASRARAMLDGRYTPSPEDVIALAVPILKHRMALSFAARADNISVDTLVTELCANI